MRIFFCGAQGTGKSTLVHALHSNFDPQYKKIDSMSKLFLTEKRKNVQTNIDSPEYFSFQKEILLYCLNLYIFEPEFISSRSIIDSYAYLYYALRHTKTNKENIGRLFSILQMYEDSCFGDDTLYFYLPVEFEISKDGNALRNTDDVYQKEIEKLMMDSIEEIKNRRNVNFYTVTGTVEERLIKVKEILNQYNIKC